MADIRQVTPPEAKRILDTTPDAVYLDVRTPEEFAAGHPAGAINVPAFLKGILGLHPNEDFLSVVERILPRDRAILCGCAAGGRSQKAAEILVAAGYLNLANVQGGFGGARNAFGKVVAAGWLDSGLPVSNDVSEAVCYEGLLRKAGAGHGIDNL
jgi:rhodanese-related sulfurtransferase